MTARARVMLTKRVPAGTGVSYGHTYTDGSRREPGRGAARLRRRGSPARVQHRPGAARRRTPDDLRAGLHGPVRARLRRRPGGRRRRGDAVRQRRRRRADRRRLGRGGRHDQLRDRHPVRRHAGAPGLRRRAGASERSRPDSAVPPATAPRAGSAGIVGAAVGVAAAGLAAGVATERTLVRRLKADPADRYAHETFGEQRYDEAFRLELPDGTDIHVEVVEPTRPVPGRPTVVLVHGFCLDMGTFHFQRQMLAARGDYRIVGVRPARSRPVRPAGDRGVRPRGARPDAAPGDRPDRPGRAAGAGRPLDGRHDHHGVRRAVPGAVR